MNAIEKIVNKTSLVSLSAAIMSLSSMAEAEWPMSWQWQLG